jgi:hypothetical protein
MTEQLTVGTVSGRPAGGYLGAVTLPESLSRADGEADLVGLAGTAGWADAAADAIRAGARGILVTAPVAEDTAELERIAAEASVPVVLDTLWAGNPAVETASAAFAAVKDAETLIEARVNLPLGADLDQAALDQVALLRRAAGAVAELRFVRRDSHGYDALATLESGAPASLAAILSAGLPQAATVRVIKPVDAVELYVPSPDTAAPGRAVVSGPDGETLLPTHYETGARASWRRLRGLVLAGDGATDLADFAADVRIVRAAVR